MPNAGEQFLTVAAWLEAATIPFALDDQRFGSAVDQLLGQLDSRVTVLGCGEPLHGGEEFLQLRNRLFQHLVANHGYTAIALESSWSRGLLVNDYVCGQSRLTLPELAEAGFSHGFGRLTANQELVSWLRDYNAVLPAERQAHFYGCDLPLATAGPANPQATLDLALAYLAELRAGQAAELRERITPLLSATEHWEDPAAWRDPATSPTLCAAANALRPITEDLITALQIERPSGLAQNPPRYTDALQAAVATRALLNFALALTDATDYTASLAIRDAAMADTVVAILDREQEGGKVLVFAHNAHLQRSPVEWQLGEQVVRWWPAGAHLTAVLQRRYAVIGGALGSSEANGIAEPETDTLEAQLIATPGPARFLPTTLGDGLPLAEIAALPVRTRSVSNASYLTALSVQSCHDFDALAVFDTIAGQRAEPPAS